MTTANAVNVGLAGSTGSGNFVGATSPTLITPTLGAATATSVTFSPTTGGIVGTATNDNAGSGFVGQYITQSVPIGSATSISNNTATNIVSISLSAGDWDVRASMGIVLASTTNMSSYFVGINSASATLPTQGAEGGYVAASGLSTVGAAQLTLPVGTARFSLSTTTTIYLVANISFSVSTTTVYGFIGARRVR